MSVKVFDLVSSNNTINDSFATESAICSLEGAGNNVFVGSSLGEIVCFSVQEHPGTSGKVDLNFAEWNKAQLPARKPVHYMCSASALNRLLALCDGMIFFLTLQDLKVLGNSKLRNVVCFAANCNPTNDDPFVFEIAVGIQRRSIYLATVSTENFQIVKEIQIEDIPITLAVDGQSLCYATERHYYLCDTQTERQQSLFPIDTQEATAIVQNVAKQEFLLAGMQGLAVFANADGVSNRPPICWGTDLIRSVALLHPYLITLGHQFLTVHSVLDQQLKQKLPFSDGRCVKNFDGQLLIATRQELYKLNPVSWDKQIEILLAEKKVDDALEVAETAINRMAYDENVLLTFDRLKQQAGFIRLEQNRWSDAKQLFVESEIDLRELVSLYPGLMPISSVFTRSVPPLHNLPDITQITRNDPQLTKQSMEFLKDILLESRSAAWAEQARKEIYTCLLKLCAQEDIGIFEEIISSKDFVLDTDDCLEWLNEHECHQASAALHYSMQRFTDAFAIWKRLELGAIHDSIYPGLDYVVQKLSACKNTKTIMSNVIWLAERSAESCLQVLLANHEQLDPDRLTVILEPFPTVLLPYLEHLVDEGCRLERFHTQLVMLYLNRITHSKSEDRLELRKKLRPLLVRSHLYNVEMVLEAIHNDPKLDVEKAFLMGKTGNHEGALNVLVKDLSDYASAEEYCAIFSVQMKRAERQSLHLSLLKALLSAEGSVAMEKVILCLNRPDLDADLAQVLKMLPDDWCLSVIAPFILRCIQRLYGIANLAVVGVNLAKCNRNQNERKQMDISSRSFSVTEKTCAVCNDFFMDTDFWRYPSGAVIHRDCVRHKHLCPATNTVSNW